MELPSCHRFHSAPTVTGAPRIVEWQPLRDFNYPWREEQIFRYLLDRPGADRLPLHNTSRQKYLPSVIDEE
jgi:hypothetical protein